MKKIATITFHWATNYGAVLQAYALQQYLKKQGFDTEIINYVPFRVWAIQTFMAIKSRNRDVFVKERKMRKFRRAELEMTKKTYLNNRSLFALSNKYDAVICGSDQIWNQGFTMRGEAKPTLSYFLNFAGENTKRFSYAASFGLETLPDDMAKLIKPELDSFSAVSVREQSGKKILDGIGIDSTVVADPTLLLDAADYNALIDGKTTQNAPKVFSYILHSGQKNAEQISRYVCSALGEQEKPDRCLCGIYDWLGFEKNSDFIVTNSFHGTVFALVFHTPFITVPVENSKMNGRIETLLKAVGLEDRIVSDMVPAEVDKLLSSEINWDEVSKRIQDMRKASYEFLKGV